MFVSKKAAAMAAGLIAALAAVTLAQSPPASRADETLAVGDATIDWIEKSDVSALREGVIDKMELQVGHTVALGGTIGLLHTEIAELTVAKARVAATNTAAAKKAEAQRELAIAILARSHRLQIRDKNAVSIEVKVASAMLQEAMENQKLAIAELDLAKQALKEHTIVAPFDGVITERMKNPGESVRANEPVVRMGKIDKLRISAWIPIEYGFRVKVGDAVEVTPNIPGAVLPIELKKVPGKITFVDPEAEPVETKVRVFAEIENKDHELRPGLKADMIIRLNTAATQAPAVGALDTRRPQ
jgi:RND family efflux transporter MFP subunit